MTTQPPIDTSPINAMIGYCQSLEVGTVITENYVKRMHEYYIPNLYKLIESLQAEAQKFTSASSEISDNEMKLIEKYRELSQKGDVVIINESELCSRTLVPVLVPLDKCIKALDSLFREKRGAKNDSTYARELAETVLDAAEVPYVE